jgi:hypothetical protein
MAVPKVTVSPGLRLLTPMPPGTLRAAAERHGNALPGKMLAHLPGAEIIREIV